MVSSILLPCLILLGFPIVQATNVLPRGDYAEVPSKAFIELRDVITHPRNAYVGDLPPRLHFPAKPLMPHASKPQDEAAAVKSLLLGKRQNCPSGFGYCYTSGKCCPNSDGNGKCCDDGTCVDGKTQTCCLYGGSCNGGTKCCKKGCAPEGTDCCGDNHHCDAGYFCCGSNNKCAPNGGECCMDGSVCPSGKLCVIFDGKQTCCKDLSCDKETSSNSGGSTGGNNRSGGNPGGDVPVPPPVPTFSIPDITIPSFNPSDYPTLAPPTLPPLPSIPNFTKPTITAPPVSSITVPPTLTATYTRAPGAVLSTYTSRLTYFYYFVFVTTTTFIRTESTFLTSEFTSSTTQVTALATDRLDANLIFDDLALSLLDMDTVTLTASDATGFDRTHVEPTTTRSSARVGGGGSSQITGAAAGGSGSEGSVGAVSGGERSVVMIGWDWGVWLWAAVSVGAGVGMAWL